MLRGAAVTIGTVDDALTGRAVNAESRDGPSGEET
jgi:hypothetical protein